MTLTAPRLVFGKVSFTGGYVVGKMMIFLVDPEGIEVRRDLHGLHVLRDGQDILRRTPRHCWVFENFGDRIDPPLRLTPPGITCPSALAWFLKQHSVSRVLPLNLLAEQVTEGEIAGRLTWVLREAPTAGELDSGRLASLEVDQEHLPLRPVRNDLRSQRFLSPTPFLTLSGTGSGSHSMTRIPHRRSLTSLRCPATSSLCRLSQLPPAD